MRTFLIIPTACVMAAGCCGTFDGPICTMQFVYGLTVQVTDENGDPVVGATLTLTEAEYVEVVPGPPGSGVELEGGTYLGAGERAGTYTLTVESPGFEPVTIENIVIEADECHVISVTREVTLTRS